MKLSLLSLMFKRYSLEKTFEITSQLGYDGLEIWGARPHAYPYDMDEAAIDRVLRLKDKYRLEVPVYTPELLAYPYNICTQDKKERAETIAYVKQALKVGKAIGAEYVQTAFDHSGYGVTRRKIHDMVIPVIQELCEYADKTGVFFMLEPVTIWESNVGASLYDVVDIVEKAGCPNLKVMLDTATPFSHFEPFGEFLDLLGDRVVHIHFQDSDGHSDAHLPLGEGSLPLEDLIGILRRHGYDKYLSVELLWPYIRDPELYASEAIRKVRRLLNEAD